MILIKAELEIPTLAVKLQMGAGGGRPQTLKECHSWMTCARNWLEPNTAKMVANSMVTNQLAKSIKDQKWVLAQFCEIPAPSHKWSSLVAQMVKISLPAMQKAWLQSLGLEDPLEKEMATHSSISWENPWTEEPSRLQSMGPAKSPMQLTS